MSATIEHVLTLFFLLGALVCFAHGAASRSLPTTIIQLVVALAFLAVAVGLRGAVIPALGLIVLGVAVAPFVLLAAATLTEQKTPSRIDNVSIAVVAAASVGIVMGWGGWLSPVAAMSPATPPAVGGGMPWVAALLFVAILTVMGLVGFGERGVLGQRDGDLAP